jgi:DDE family transposase
MDKPGNFAGTMMCHASYRFLHHEIADQPSVILHLRIVTQETKESTATLVNRTSTRFQFVQFPPEVYRERPADQHLLLPAVEAHRRKLGRVPGWVAAAAGFYSRANEEAVQALGVKYVSIPNRNTRSEQRRRLEKQRWFKKGQKWRTGCEGRISVLKRRHGLTRSRYHGLQGMLRWVGLGVIADNLINIGRHLALQRA